MKKTCFSILALVTALASPLVHAANEGPSGAPSPISTARVIAELNQSGGYAPRPGINRGVRVRSDGAVEKYSHQLVTPLAKLDPALVARLEADIDAAPVAELVDLQADRPMCADAPTTTYSVYPVRGEIVNIFGRSGCHDFSRQDGFGAEIKALLQAFDSI